jgi:hypothetical protein
MKHDEAARVNPHKWDLHPPLDRFMKRFEAAVKREALMIKTYLRTVSKNY